MKRQLVSEEDVMKSLCDVPGFEEGRKEQATLFRLGEKLRYLRTSQLGISQGEAATLIGIKKSKLSRIETGLSKRAPSFLSIIQIISAYEAYLQQSDRAIHVSLSISISSDDSDEVEMMPLTGVDLSS